MRTRPLSITHRQKIEQLQQAIERQRGQPLTLTYGKGNSNTTRSKSYKKGCASLSCHSLNQVIKIDQDKKRIWVEPRLTMEELVKATLPYGLMPPTVPEFKGITVGGAILGAAAESSSHQWGIFHDSCTGLHFLNGKGELIQTTPDRNEDLYYGLSGSYGSLGLLVAAEIQLVPAQKSVRLTYHNFESAHLALEKMQTLVGNCDFVDGIIFASNHTVLISGKLTEEPAPPYFQQWFAKQVQQNSAPQLMPLYDYLFRYDQGAFWMGSFLFSLPFLTRYLTQGLLNIWPNQGWFTETEIAKFKSLPLPGILATVTQPLMKSQRLWGLLHKAERWVQDRLVIQDFCIPFPQAAPFLSEILRDPGTFPIWLCPIQGTTTPQFLSPHYGHPLFLNFGIYGVPSYSAPMSQIMNKLENTTRIFNGRKVLYSRSFYDSKTFWQIYPKSDYDQLRQKTYACGIWRDLTEKVLSE